LCKSRYIEDVNEDPGLVIGGGVRERKSSDGLWPQAVAIAIDSSSILVDSSPTGRSHDLADCSPHQAGNGAQGGKLDPFPPHLLHDVRRQTRVESGS